MRTIKYFVHGVSHDEAEVDAEVAGIGVVRAKIPVLTVEAVSTDGSSGHTFRFPQPTDEDIELFVPGAEIEVSFSTPA